ncbi:hypothetical protein LAWI1_G006800 [Lachnellula willkommii]|uniref:Uncharacterized protein n=1 Tax=Lachnellula willkommii TaxID=215461 RepID=A0A559M3B6_9HELO|nr:hypothetical protein LAWI1_G006800 [Lachnellula willkommii]
MAKLEKELGLALEEQQVELLLAYTPTSLSPYRPRHYRIISRVENAAKPLEQQETRVAIESLGRRELGKEALIEETGGVEI